MSSRPFDAIVFDFDGTLVDSAPGLAHALNRLLGELGCAPLDLATVTTMVGDGAAKLVERGLAHGGLATAHEHVERFLALYGAAPAYRTAAVPGALGVLDELRAAGCRTAVCTNKPQAMTEAILAALSLADRFDAVVGGDTVLHKKPDPEHVLTCLERLAVPPDRAVMVGDSCNDLLAARGAGVPVVLVSYGYSRDPVRGLGADAVIGRLDELPRALARLRAKRHERAPRCDRCAGSP
jgi:phosphoglycolate phosphatase